MLGEGVRDLGNCPSCNAPITGEVCEYCGRHFRIERQWDQEGCQWKWRAVDSDDHKVPLPRYNPNLYSLWLGSYPHSEIEVYGSPHFYRGIGPIT